MSYEPPAASTPFTPGTATGVDLERPSRRGRRGRVREWEILSAALRAAEDGRGDVVLIEGPSGIGKSVLLDDAARAAAGRGFAVARGMADEASRLAPLAPLLAALRESVHTLRPAWGDAARDPVDLRFWLVEQIQVRLEERAARRPLLITLDDLQWADHTTLLAVRTLIPELASYPVVWLLSRTTGSGGDGAERLFDVLVRDGTTRITVEALDDGAVAEVVADVTGAAPDRRLLDMVAGAGGNPFILVELLAGLRDEGAVRVVDGRARLISARIPRRLQEVARSGLSRMSAGTRHLLRVAAVLGRTFYVDDLVEMLGEPAGRLLPALEEAEAVGVLTPAGDALTFRHDLLWRAVTETLTVPARRALHRQAADILLARGGSAIPAAAHLMRGARSGDAAALAALDRAAREVLPSSPQIAADLTTRALDLTTRADRDRFGRTVAAVYALTSAGRLPEAAALARRGLEQVTRPGRSAHLRYELAYVLMLAGRPGEAVAEAEKALADADLPGELRGLAEQVLFRGLFASHEYTRGRSRAEAVVRSWESRDPRERDSRATPAVVGARMLLTGDAWAEGRATEALGHIRAAVRAAWDGPIRAQHAHPRLHLATLLTDLRRFDEAEAELRTAGEEITALGHTAHTASPALFHSRLRLAEGRLDDAVADAQAGLALADELGMRAFVLIGHATLTIVAVRRGDLDAAAGHAEQLAGDHRDGRGVMYGRGWGEWAMSLAAEARAGPAAALERLGVSYTDPTERRWLLMTEPDAAGLLTRVALAAGDRAGAEAVVATAAGLARDNPEFGTLAASAAHAHGVLHGDHAALSRAAAAHAGPWSRASAAEDLGMLLARTAAAGQGDREAAVRTLDEALEGYQRVGALRDAARVRARLRELGVRRRHWNQAERPVSGWASLTETERNVAALVGQGLTNRQVGTRMFVSPHTVKFHLRQVFRKLGIASRVELARIAAARAPGTVPSRPAPGAAPRGGGEPPGPGRSAAP